MKLSELTEKQVREAATRVNRAVKLSVDSAVSGNRSAAYKAAEEAQEAAFELKQLFALTEEEIATWTKEDQS